MEVCCYAILEGIGSGGGQATAPILSTGCQLTAVEYEEQFSELLKEKCKEYQNFSVITGKFEDAINKYGGTVTIYDTIDLQLERKR